MDSLVPILRCLDTPLFSMQGFMSIGGSYRVHGPTSWYKTDPPRRDSLRIVSLPRWWWWRRMVWVSRRLIPSRLGASGESDKDARIR